MSASIDLKLSKNLNNVYDIVLASNGDFQGVNSFDTSIEMSLFNNRRASPSEVPTSNLREGWWGNLISDWPGFEVGSKLWLLRQARLTTTTINLAISYANDALSWMITDGYATKIDVTAQQNSPTSMGLNINFYRPNSIVVNKYYELWNNTGNLS